MKKTSKFFIFLFFLLLMSCSTKQEQNIEKIKTFSSKIETLNLTFSGDLMAHDVNFQMKDYNNIYENVKPILMNDDLSFTNMEMPISDKIPLSSYPRFNVHSSYLKAAADAGFDVFSLANNHTNDQGIFGMTGTLESANKVKKQLLEKNRLIYFSGIKINPDEAISPTLIKYKNWTIQYLSVTELLNSYGKSKYKVYYSKPDKAGRQNLLKIISNARKNTPSDLFILSLHLSEAEYGLKVTESKKLWFNELAKNGVDIICASHPHVMQTWEVFNKPKKNTTPPSEITNPNTNSLSKIYEIKNDPLNSAFFMYSMGNFISGQRMRLNYANPSHYREYTGDAVLLQVKLTKIDGIVENSFEIKPIPITVYKEPCGYVVKQFTEKWISELSGSQKKYYEARLKLMKDYLPF